MGIGSQLGLVLATTLLGLLTLARSSPEDEGTLPQSKAASSPIDQEHLMWLLSDKDGGPENADLQLRKRRQVLEPSNCTGPPEPIPHMLINVLPDGHSAVANCLDHYQTLLNTTSISWKCVEGKWVMQDIPEDFSQEMVRCAPVCDPPCEHGVCSINSSDNATHCMCPGLYSGRACEIQGCKSLPAIYKGDFYWSELSHDLGGKTNTGPLIMASQVIGKCHNGTSFYIADLKNLMPGEPAPTELKFICEKGKWKVFVPGHDVYIDSEKGKCEYICNPPCQNDGSCTLTRDGVRSCRCTEEYTGDQCLIKKCADITLHSQLSASSQLFNTKESFGANKYSGTVWKNCPSGYSHTSTGNNTYMERCEDGRWVKPDGLCEPLCEPACLNNGTCVQPNICLCPSIMTGTYCQSYSCLNAWTPTINRAVYKTEVHQLTISCKKGYTFPSGETSIVFKCLDGEWDMDTIKVQILCVPDCSKFPCLNGGLCIQPDTCKCPQDFTGPQCQTKACPIPAKYVLNGDSSLSAPYQLQYNLTCREGYKLITNQTSMSVNCTEGVWHFPEGLQDSFTIACRPVCNQPCFNGGRCIAPQTCRCPEGFTGKSCSQRYEKTIEEGVNCRFPFKYRSKWYHSCTTVGYKFPWCATEVEEVSGDMLQWSICRADVGLVRVRLTKNKQVCQLPFNYQGQLHYTCTKAGATEAWCATAVDETLEVTLNDTCLDQSQPTREVILTTGGFECHADYLPGQLHHLPMVTDGEAYGHCNLSLQIGIVHNQDEVTENPLANLVLIDNGYRMNKITMSGKSCKLPFSLGGHMYYGCVTLGHRSPRCPTEVDDNGAVLEEDECIDSFYLGQGIRQLTLTSVISNSPGSPVGMLLASMRLVMTLAGQRCIFPFMHLGETYYGCSYLGSSMPWCATQVDTEGEAVTRAACPTDWDFYSYRKYLISLYAGYNNVDMSISGLQCEPFSLDGQIEKRCIQKEGQLSWCAVDVTIANTSASTDFCVAPYGKDSHHQSFVDNSFRDYIITLLVVVKFRMFNPSHEAGAYLLYTIDGLNCKPFLHDRELQYGCIEEENKRPWCATSVDAYENPTETGLCPYNWRYWRFFLAQDPEFWSPFIGGLDVTLTERGQQCVFPFINKGRLYRQCVEDEGKRSWCATLVDRDGQVLRKDICSNTKGIVVKSVSGKSCVPFLRDGVMQTGCVEPPGGARPWCAIKVDALGLPLNRDLCRRDWKVYTFTVPETTPRKRNVSGEVVETYTQKGERCLPFVYLGILERNCVETEIVDEEWCATEVDTFGSAIRNGTCIENWRDIVWPPGSGLSNNSSSSSEVDETAKTPCIPFKHEGVMVYGCLEPTFGPPICAVAVDENQMPTHTEICKPDWYITFSVKDANITDKEDTVDDNHCIFPFRYKDQLHTNCTLTDAEAPWCATEVNGRLQAVVTAYCKELDSDVLPSNPPPMEIDSDVLPSNPPPLDTEDTFDENLCIFPFRYKDQLHANCTLTDAEAPWCATKVNGRLQPVVTAYCKELDSDVLPSNPPPIATTVTVDNRKCKFPFEWNNITYNWCTSTDRPAPWCATQLNEHNQPLTSGYCSNTLVGPVPSQPPPTVSKDAELVKDYCIFPFVYKGMTYHTCTREDSVVFWCALEVDAQHHPVKVGCCSENEEPVDLNPTVEFPDNSEHVLTEEGEECLFPFQHLGEWHYSCIATPSTNRPWCVTAVDAFERPLTSGYCLHGTEPKPFPPPKGYVTRLTEEGKKCVFPFWYGGRWYVDCTFTNHHKPWCAIASNSHGVVLSAQFCLEDSALEMNPLTQNVTVNGVKCVLPFVYLGKKHCHCTSVGDTMPWCATKIDRDFHVLSKGYCKAIVDESPAEEEEKDQKQNSRPTDKLSPSGLVMTVNGDPCVFPFRYKGVQYKQCACVDAKACWCATAVTLDRQPAVSGYCKDLVKGPLPTFPPPSFGQDSKLTVDGCICAFPFVYNGVTYTRCTTQDSTHPWCATLVDEQRVPITTAYCRDSRYSKVPNQLPPNRKLLSTTLVPSMGMKDMMQSKSQWWKNWMFPDLTFVGALMP